MIRTRCKFVGLRLDMLTWTNLKKELGHVTIRSKFYWTLKIEIKEKPTMPKGFQDLGKYTAQTGEKFHFLFDPQNKIGRAIVFTSDQVGSGFDFCQVEAISAAEAREKLAKKIGPGSF